ncbi:MAG: hypothetical protein EA401_01730 [Planctomycetota bacterium]|nr:MAG: hypothetical protein EA401_01730 [Planctomycetota bacterium]
MNQHTCAKSIYDLAGILAFCFAAVVAVHMLILIAVGIFDLFDSSQPSQITMFIALLIPHGITLAVSISIAMACRHWSRQSHGDAHPQSEHTVSSQDAFTLLAGLAGFTLMLLVLYRLFGEGDIRIAQGLSMNDRVIPFTAFIDLAIFFLFGLLLFVRPRLVYALWMRLRGSTASEYPQA